ncbi:MAG: hypothetical protein OIN87_01180 [Candidatus Methanoperedens sp.]|nr:hypothetical protein [Candidatus Methanoperedens sp.]
MNDKNSKVPIYIAILIAVILVAAGGYFLLGGTSKMTPEENDDVNEAPIPTVKETTEMSTGTSTGTSAKTAGETPKVVAAPPRVETIKCELCHTNAQDLNPHVNGGKLCMTCHGSQVHNIHIGPSTINLQCDTCHGFPPKIPSVDKSADGPGHYSVCENCHAAPPDSLKPSLGNLITVHLSRSKYCTNCHGTDIAVIHAAKLANATKK